MNRSDVQRNTVVNNVDMSSLRTLCQNGPYKFKGTMTKWPVQKETLFWILISPGYMINLKMIWHIITWIR